MTKLEFLWEVPAGSQLYTYGDKIVLVSPDMPVAVITPTGLEPLLTPEPLPIPRGGVNTR